MEEEQNTQLYTESATGPYCYQNDGRLVDYKTILDEHELQIADGINKSLDMCKESVFKAFERFGGDFESFKTSNLCKLIYDMKIAKTLDSYNNNPKLKEHGLTSRQLKLTTSSKLKEMFPGQDPKIKALATLRNTMDQQLLRAKNSFVPFLEALWVIFFFVLKCIFRLESNVLRFLRVNAEQMLKE